MADVTQYQLTINARYRVKLLDGEVFTGRLMAAGGPTNAALWFNTERTMARPSRRRFVPISAVAYIDEENN